MTYRDVDDMPAAERFAEIAQILARGYQQLRGTKIKAHEPPRNAANRLDAVAAAEAPCRAMSKVSAQ